MLDLCLQGLLKGLNLQVKVSEGFNSLEGKVRDLERSQLNPTQPCQCFLSTWSKKTYI